MTTKIRCVCGNLIVIERDLENWEIYIMCPNCGGTVEIIRKGG